MNRDQKAAVVQEIAADIESADAVFAVDYRGISVPQAAELRAKLREADASFRIVKNSLTERAADQAGAASLRELLDGPTALTFVRGDAALAAKALNDFRRANDVLAFKGGTMAGEVLSVDQIVSIARLPSREMLHAQLVGTVAAPLTGLVRGLNALIAGVAIQLQQIADQGLVTGEAPAEAEAEAEAPAEAEAEAEAEAPAEAEAEAPADAPEADAHATPEPDQENEADAPADADDNDAAEAKEDA